MGQRRQCARGQVPLEEEEGEKEERHWGQYALSTSVTVDRGNEDDDRCRAPVAW